MVYSVSILPANSLISRNQVDIQGYILEEHILYKHNLGNTVSFSV